MCLCGPSRFIDVLCLDNTDKCRRRIQHNATVYLSPSLYKLTLELTHFSSAIFFYDQHRVQNAQFRMRIEKNKKLIENRSDLA